MRSAALLSILAGAILALASALMSNNLLSLISLFLTITGGIWLYILSKRHILMEVEPDKGGRSAKVKEEKE